MSTGDGHFRGKVHGRYPLVTDRREVTGTNKGSNNIIRGCVAVLVRAVEQKSAKIRVKTTIWNDGENEAFELTTFGRYYEKNESIFLQYEEVIEEGTVKSIVKVSKKEALILRSGAVNMRMVFEEDKKHAGRYETPFGIMRIETMTKRLDHQVGSNTGSMDILYDLHMQGALAGTYHLEISFEEEKNEHC